MKFLQYIIRSSADPRNISLTVKGFLGMFAGLFIMFTGVSEMDTQTIIDTIAVVVQNALLLISSLVTIYGLLRKVYYEIKKNPKAKDIVDIIEE